MRPCPNIQWFCAESLCGESASIPYFLVLWQPFDRGYAIAIAIFTEIDRGFP
ncbi:hypothetical protein IQ249_05740 [Lusitaniella coriacea LEGE 07157]|uniref:Uncharacterized protein n=1 Tax=Lusitaniella coriacea LEGE 07157 TaxID=945747 RepID=A0A8J7AP78_9CYAN|nr:hypothetical protein [Lusitaniella coriacea]MBE9115398.1 hypothetical protein [Lusitaniella coriacea LEGE 07157]